MSHFRTVSLSVLVLVVVFLLGLKFIRPNFIARDFSQSIALNKIVRVEVINCSANGPILAEIIPDQPALYFHKRVKENDDVVNCGVHVFNSKGSDETTLNQMLQSTGELERRLNSSYLFWNPFFHDLVRDGVYFSEKDDARVYAVYFAQSSDNFGALAVWNYSNSQWQLESLEYTGNSEFYKYAKSLFMP